MQATSIDRRIPVPRRWSRHVRSAIVHAVSMANVAFTATRARAARHFNVRVRLQAELDQRDWEISLLREEFRIKAWFRWHSSAWNPIASWSVVDSDGYVIQFCGEPWRAYLEPDNASEARASEDKALTRTTK